MPLWLWFVDSLAVLVGIVILMLVWVVVRRGVLIRRAGAAFDMSVSREVEPGRGWMLGFAIYRDHELYWFRAFSLSLRPKYRFARGEVVIRDRRAPINGEAQVLHADHVVVESDNALGVRKMALSEGALTGLLSWLESSPPGRGVNRVV